MGALRQGATILRPGVLQLTDEMRFGIRAAVLFSSTIGLMPSAVARVIPQENDSAAAPLSDRREPNRRDDTGFLPGHEHEPDDEQAHVDGVLSDPDQHFMGGPPYTVNSRSCDTQWRGHMTTKTINLDSKRSLLSRTFSDFIDNC